MRHGTSNRRSRSRGNGGRRGGSNNRSQVFDSNGPEVRIRGTAHQICEKYTALAKDARGAGDEILAESYLQHAEHYQRLINSWNEQDGQQQQQNAGGKSKEAYNQKEGGNDDDLGLPASILGKEVETDAEEGSGNVRAKKKELESA